MNEMQCKLISVEKEMDHFGSRSHMTNLTIYGLREPHNDSPEMLQEGVNEILESKLGITTTIVKRRHKAWSGK